MNPKWYVLTLILGLLLIEQSNAQYLSVKGDFEVDQQLGCFNLTVTATNINSGTGTIIYQFDGFNSATTSNPIHTYTTPGTYWINQYIQGATGEKKDSISVVVVSPETPEVELLSCNNLELSVQINDSYYDVYEIDYGDGTIINVNKNTLLPPYSYTDNTTRNVIVTGLFSTATNRCGINSNSFTPTTTVLPAQIDSLIALDNSSLKLDFLLPAHSINKLEVSINDNLNYQLFKNLSQNSIIDTLVNLNITQNSYCFRIATYDACSNFRSYSNEVCSVGLSTSDQNNQITIDWNTINLGAGQIINLFRDNTLLQSHPSSDTQHIDSTVVCNTTYCYQVETDFGGGVSRSLTICDTAFSIDSPPTVDNISSTTNSDSINWTWQIPINTTPSYYIAHQLNNAGDILKSDSVNSPQFINSFDNTTKFLAIELHDVCNNKSPIGNVGSNVFLSGETNNTQDIVLNWNSYLGWIDGIDSYSVTIKDSNDNLLDSISTGSSPTFTLLLDDQTEQTLLFTVWAIPLISGIEYSRSNILIFEREPIISIPNTFTPNGDGLNDKFVATGKFIEAFELQIFNRWGEVLYYTTDMENGWDGTSNNSKMPVGNYTYWMRLKDLNDNEHIRTGSILILSN